MPKLIYYYNFCTHLRSNEVSFGSCRVMDATTSQLGRRGLQERFNTWIPTETSTTTCMHNTDKHSLPRPQIINLILHTSLLLECILEASHQIYPKACVYIRADVSMRVCMCVLYIILISCVCSTTIPDPRQPQCSILCIITNLVLSVVSLPPSQPSWRTSLSS